MSEMRILRMESIGRKFIPDQYLHEGEDEYYLRNAQSAGPVDRWRNLTAEEVEALVKNANTADSWDNILVTEQFTPHSIKNCEFSGLVRIGRLEEVYLEYHDMHVPVGLTNSRIVACDIGDDSAVHNVRYLAHYIIGDNVILLNIDEMHTTDHAKFGNGIVKEGENEEVRIVMDLINEAGGRCVMPFDGMTSGDAYLWAKYRDDKELLEKLGEITQRTFDPRRGFYGTIGQKCVIKNCRIIKDVKVGTHCYIKGANKLKNLTINSSPEEPSQIGEGVELINGIVGLGCHVFYGCKAVRFVMGNNSHLKYGARLIHSYLGDNSTISCCEVISNLIFPCHEQHHNNSFLIASLVMGQSNIAAAATIGSNHNSRAPDGEIQAGRGFWPALCVSLKHCCRFASFVLTAKGDYPAELDMPLPFSLLSNDVTNGRLLAMPGYWWLHNMYALVRNAWKFTVRDTRKTKVQKIEFDYLAPDTAEEMFAAMDLLALWTAKAHLRTRGQSPDEKSAGELIRLGQGLLSGPAENVDSLEVLGDRMERSSRKAVILKAHAGCNAYRRMLHYYAAKNLLAYMEANAEADLSSMCRALAGKRQRQWVNLGGQLVQADDLEAVRRDIRNGKLNSWSAIHQAYDALWDKYPLDKQRHAFATLLDLLGVTELSPQLWSQSLDRAVETQRHIADQTFLTRKKDDEDPFRRITFANEQEKTSVLGRAEDNSFVEQVREETAAFADLVDKVRRR